jgi:hypothetical protein
MNPFYLRMKLYFWLAASRRFLWRFRLKPGFRVRRWRGYLRPAYPIWIHHLLDLLGVIEKRTLSKYWRYWIDIQLGDMPNDVLSFVSAQFPSCKQVLIRIDEHSSVLCACQETLHSDSLNNRQLTEAAIQFRRPYRHLEGEVKTDL